MVDIHAIGAGGGSLIRTANNGLTVGPESAGSSPGPVCYGRGGTEPTVTDADLVLGRLDPASFWNGRLHLDKDGAREALASVGSWHRTWERRRDGSGSHRHHRRPHGRRRSASSVPGRCGACETLRSWPSEAWERSTQPWAVRHAGHDPAPIPAAAPAFSASELLTADHVIYMHTRSLVREWREGRCRSADQSGRCAQFHGAAAAKLARWPE